MAKVTLSEQDIKSMVQEVALEMQLQNVYKTICENKEYQKVINESEELNEGIMNFIKRLGLTALIYKALDMVLNKLGVDKSKPFGKFMLSFPVKAIIAYKVAKSMTKGGVQQVPAVQESVDEFNISTAGTGALMGAAGGGLTSIVMKVLLKDIIGVSDHSPLANVFSIPVVMTGLGTILGGVMGANQPIEGGLINKATGGLNNLLNGTNSNATDGSAYNNVNPGMANAPDLGLIRENKLDEAVDKAIKDYLDKQ